MSQTNEGLQVTRTLCLILVMALAGPRGLADADQEAATGHLLIIGGGLKADNGEIFRRFLKLAGDPKTARIGVFPTASATTLSATLTMDLLHQYGLPPGSVDLLEITVDNAATSTADPAMLDRIGRCTGLFFTGGDQRRIGHAFVNADGSDTPALAAIRAVWNRGGVVGGTSAGAACMGKLMLSSRGPAIDSLDFGLSKAPHHRGAMVERGLGLFQAGPIDQHFSHRGRLARLTRVLLESDAPLGFGIDEDTAIDVAANDSFEVLGRGGVTVIDTSRAKASNTALGYSAWGIRLNYLERGDRYHPQDQTCSIHPGKALLKNSAGADQPDEIGLIGDLGQVNAVKKAISVGLAMSPLEQRAGLFIRARGGQGYGYRFLFRKTPETQAYRGRVEGDGDGEADDRYSILNVLLDIGPITASLESPETTMPVDLDDSRARELIQSLVFRGIMPANPEREFHPSNSVSRAEFAGILVRATGTGLWRAQGVTIPDVSGESLFTREIAAAVGAGLLSLGSDGRFYPEERMSEQEVCQAFARAAVLASKEENPSAVAAPAPAKPDDKGPATDSGKSQALTVPRNPPMTREQLAVAIGQFLGLPWGIED